MCIPSFAMDNSSPATHSDDEIDIASIDFEEFEDELAALTQIVEAEERAQLEQERLEQEQNRNEQKEEENEELDEHEENEELDEHEENDELDEHEENEELDEHEENVELDEPEENVEPEEYEENLQKTPKDDSDEDEYLYGNSEEKTDNQRENPSTSGDRPGESQPQSSAICVYPGVNAVIDLTSDKPVEIKKEVIDLDYDSDIEMVTTTTTVVEQVTTVKMESSTVKMESNTVKMESNTAKMENNSMEEERSITQSGLNQQYNLKADPPTEKKVEEIIKDLKKEITTQNLQHQITLSALQRGIESIKDQVLMQNIVKKKKKKKPSSHKHEGSYSDRHGHKHRKVLPRIRERSRSRSSSLLSSYSYSRGTHRQRSRSSSPEQRNHLKRPTKKYSSHHRHHSANHRSRSKTRYKLDRSCSRSRPHHYRSRSRSRSPQDFHRSRSSSRSPLGFRRSRSISVRKEKESARIPRSPSPLRSHTRTRPLRSPVDRRPSPFANQSTARRRSPSRSVSPITKRPRRERSPDKAVAVYKPQLTSTFKKHQLKRSNSSSSSSSSISLPRQYSKSKRQRSSSSSSSLSLSPKRNRPYTASKESDIDDFTKDLVPHYAPSHEASSSTFVTQRTYQQQVKHGFDVVTRHSIVTTTSFKHELKSFSKSSKSYRKRLHSDSSDSDDFEKRIQLQVYDDSGKNVTRNQPSGNLNHPFYIHPQDAELYKVRAQNGLPPVQTLHEICTKCRWSLPTYIVLPTVPPEQGFKFGMIINNHRFITSRLGQQKKLAKAELVKAVLQWFKISDVP